MTLTTDSIYSQERVDYLILNGSAYYLNKGINNLDGNSKDIRTAISDFTKAIEYNHEYAEAYYYRGRAKSELKFYREAIIDFSRAIEIRPEYAEAYFSRGSAKHRIRDYKGANSDLKKARIINPEYNSVNYDNSKVKYSLSKPDKIKKKGK
jgi:tetratricopeptide (TPR) repeat protein